MCHICNHVSYISVICECVFLYIWKSEGKKALLFQAEPLTPARILRKMVLFSLARPPSLPPFGQRARSCSWAYGCRFGLYLHVKIIYISIYRYAIFFSWMGGMCIESWLRNVAKKCFAEHWAEVEFTTKLKEIPKRKCVKSTKIRFRKRTEKALKNCDSFPGCGLIFN